MIKIALIQMHVEEDKYKNIENASEFIKKAAVHNGQLLFLQRKL